MIMRLKVLMAIAIMIIMFIPSALAGEGAGAREDLNASKDSLLQPGMGRNFWNSLPSNIQNIVMLMIGGGVFVFLFAYIYYTGKASMDSMSESGNDGDPQKQKKHNNRIAQIFIALVAWIIFIYLGTWLFPFF